jgi:hypothetical protein
MSLNLGALATAFKAAGISQPHAVRAIPSVATIAFKYVSTPSAPIGQVGAVYPGISAVPSISAIQVAAVPSMMPVAAAVPTTKSLSEVTQAQRAMLYQITGNAEMLTGVGDISYDLYP